MDRFKKSVLIICIVLCSLVYCTKTIDPSLAIREVIWTVCTIVLLITVRPGITKEPVIFLLAGYLGCSILPVFWTINPQESCLWISRIILIIAFYLCVVPITGKYIQKTLCIVGFLFGLIGLWQLISSDTYPGTMGYVNLWSMSMLLLLPFCMKSVFGIVTGSLLIANIMLLPTRSTKLALIVSILALSIFKPKIFFICLCLVIVIVIGGVCFLDPDITDMTSINERVCIWQQTIRMSVDNPLGIGVGNWKIKIAEYSQDMLKLGKRVFDKRFFQRPHNDFLWVMSESGFAGAIFYIGIFSYALYKAYKLKKMREFFCLVSYVILALVSFPKERVFHTIIFVLLLAMLTEYRPVYRINMVPVMLIVITAFSLRFTSEIHLRNIRTARKSGQWARVVTEADKCFTTVDHVGVPISFYRGEASGLRGDLLQAYCDYQIAYRYNKYYPHLLTNMGNCSALFGRSEEAKRYYKESLAVNPELKYTKENFQTLRNRDKITKIAERDKN